MLSSLLNTLFFVSVVLHAPLTWASLEEDFANQQAEALGKEAAAKAKLEAEERQREEALANDLRIRSNWQMSSISEIQKCVGTHLIGRRLSQGPEGIQAYSISSKHLSFYIMFQLDGEIACKYEYKSTSGELAWDGYSYQRPVRASAKIYCPKLNASQPIAFCFDVAY